MKKQGVPMKSAAKNGLEKAAMSTVKKASAMTKAGKSMPKTKMSKTKSKY